jgi:prepilin-type N-terminal cleavage/methylation domain-containing protein
MQIKRHSIAGLTLIEFLLVLAIIAILAALWLGTSRGVFRARNLASEIDDGQKTHMQWEEPGGLLSPD